MSEVILLTFFRRFLVRLGFELFDSLAKLFALLAELGQFVAEFLDLDLFRGGGGDLFHGLFGGLADSVVAIVGRKGLQHRPGATAL